MVAPVPRNRARQYFAAVLAQLTLVWAATLSTQPAAAQKSPDIRVDSDAGGTGASTNPRIASTGSEVFVVWQDDRNGSSDIYFNRSTDAGATWLAEDIRLDTDAPGAARSTAPEMAVADRSIYVVWTDARSGGFDIRFNRSTDGGVTWLSADVRVDSRSPVVSVNAPIEPQICCDDREVGVVWQNGGLSEDIYFNHSSDGGLTWLAEDIRIDRAPASVPTTSVSPRISNSGSNVYVVWRDNRHGAISLGGFDIYGNRSTDGGRTWLADDTKVSRFGDSTGHSSALDARIESAGDNVYVAWWSLAHSGWTPDFNRSIDAGLTWMSESVRLNHDEAGGRHPEISHQGDTVYAVWTQEGPGTIDDVCFNRSFDAGTTWSTTPIRLDTGEPRAPARRPEICSSGDNVYVVWEDSRAGRKDIHFNRSTDRGDSWLPRDMRLDTDPAGAATSSLPRISATRDGVYVAWMDRRNGSDDIYFNIPSGTQPYGTGTVGSNGIVPQLAGRGVPTLGSNVSIVVSSGQGGAAGAMLIGNGPTTKIPVAVPGAGLLVIPTIAVPFVLGGPAGVAGAGTAVFALSVPREVSLVGWNLNFQGAITDAAATFGVSMTNGVEMWIG